MSTLNANVNHEQLLQSFYKELSSLEAFSKRGLALILESTEMPDRSLLQSIESIAEISVPFAAPVAASGPGAKETGTGLRDVQLLLLVFALVVQQTSPLLNAKGSQRTAPDLSSLDLASLGVQFQVKVKNMERYELCLLEKEKTCYTTIKTLCRLTVLLSSESKDSTLEVSKEADLERIVQALERLVKRYDDQRANLPASGNAKQKSLESLIELVQKSCSLKELPTGGMTRDCGPPGPSSGRAKGSNSTSVQKQVEQDESQIPASLEQLLDTIETSHRKLGFRIDSQCSFFPQEPELTKIQKKIVKSIQHTRISTQDYVES